MQRCILTSLVNILKKIANAIEKKSVSPFSTPVTKQISYLESLKEPHDLIERSFMQYKCQMKLKGMLVHSLINLASAPLLLVILLRKESPITPCRDMRDKDTPRAAYFDDLTTDIIPIEISSSFDIVPCSSTSQGRLTKKDRAFFRQIVVRYPFSWHFLLKTLVKVRQYRGVIDSINPKAFIVCSEYSFASSLMTAYLHENGIAHINVMHGEKLFFIRDSFFQFDRCYVWDDKLVDLLIDLRAHRNQFYVSIPPSLRLCIQEGRKRYDFTYYLGGETRQQLDAILLHMLKLRKKGFHLCIRPHPRYTDVSELTPFINAGIHLETCECVSIEESLSSTRHALSLYSTVLRQAYENGIPIVIDDLSDSSKYRQLQETRFAILAKPHTLLSDYIDNGIAEKQA